MSQGTASGGLASLNLLAGLTPIRIIGDYVDAAGVTRNTEYTVPSGKAAVITTLAISQQGGVAYSLLGYEFLIDGAGDIGNIVLAAPVADFIPVAWDGWLWLAETDTLDSVVVGGDSTSDYRSVVFGAEFDWTAP